MTNKLFITALFGTAIIAGAYSTAHAAERASASGERRALYSSSMSYAADFDRNKRKRPIYGVLPNDSSQPSPTSDDSTMLGKTSEMVGCSGGLYGPC